MTGTLTLMGVAASFGSLAVTIKGVLMQPGPPTASCLSAIRGIMAALCFVPPIVASGESLRKGGRLLVTAGAELALWNFLAQGLLNAALALTSAMKASFLTQTAIVLTPLLSRIRGDRVGADKWLAALAALTGVGLLGADGSTGAIGKARMAISLNIGDWLALAGALSYSLYILRVGSFASRGVDSGLSQALKTVFLAPLYCAWAAADAFRGGSFSLSLLWPNPWSITVWLLLAYSAVVPGALADVFQARGQERVPAAEAQVILASEPIFSAGFSAAFLGERLGVVGLFGAFLVFAATVVASLPNGKQQS